MGDFKMKTLVLGTVQTNCYIISNDISKEAIVFDIGDQADKVLSYLLENDLTCKAIILTHGHFDHILAVGDFAQRTGTLVYAHEAEEDLLMDPEKNSSARIRRPYSLKPDVLLKDNEELTFGELQIKVIHTPGHTGGGACYYMAELGILISGDTLFREDIGRSDLPTGDGEALVKSIKQKLMLLDDDVRVYPGHGAPTTIGHEREYNIYIR
ncbi:MAG: MBL fold metallo-hydrolase [Clostridiales bacterium]|nr:MBL fold metallo-hydrolase [Clostridiales bacterium]